MSFHPLDVVVLNTDLPTQGLKRGDLGTIVDVYDAESVEVSRRRLGSHEGPRHAPGEQSVRSGTTIRWLFVPPGLHQTAAMPNTNWSRRRTHSDAPRLSCWR